MSIFKFLLIVTAVIFNSSAFADTELPVNDHVVTNGYSKFPVLQCPATNEAMKNFRSKLESLKALIKTNANCEPTKASEAAAAVGKLDSLVTDKRPDFLNLLAKGEVAGLSEVEKGSVETYVSDLTQTGSTVLAVLTGNDACFDSEKQGLSVEFVTSLIGEGTKILGILGGPAAAPIVSIAGEAITGFMKGLAAIKKKGYNFREANQRISYAESLCTYFEYHRELQALVEPVESIERLNHLLGAINAQLGILKEQCPECAALIAKVEEEKARETKEGTVELKTVDQIWSPELEKYAKAEAERINGMYTNIVGTHTYRSLKTATWIPMRLEILEDLEEKSAPDVVLGAVILEKKDIEDFLVYQTAPQFLEAWIWTASDFQGNINAKLYAGVEMLNNIRMENIYKNRENPNALPEVVSFWTELDPVDNRFQYESTDAYFSAVFNTLISAKAQAETQNDKEAVRQIVSFIKGYKSLVRDLNDMVDLVTKYCDFFGETQWYEGEIVRQCNGWEYKALQTETLTLGLHAAMFTANGDEAPMADLAVTEGGIESALVVEAAPVEITDDWVESLIYKVEDLYTQPGYVARKTETTEVPAPQ